jgi:hypothetical protein
MIIALDTLLAVVSELRRNHCEQTNDRIESYI